MIECRHKSDSFVGLLRHILDGGSAAQHGSTEAGRASKYLAKCSKKTEVEMRRKWMVVLLVLVLLLSGSFVPPIGHRSLAASPPFVQGTPSSTVQQGTSKVQSQSDCVGYFHWERDPQCGLCGWDKTYYYEVYTLICPGYVNSWRTGNKHCDYC